LSESGGGPDDAREWVRKNGPAILLVLAFLLFIVPRISPWEGLNDNLRFGPRLSEWAIRQVERLFDDYGYYVVFFGVLMENSMFLGILVPGAIILILAGLAAENGEIHLAWVFALAIVATIIGDTVSYLIGRLGWMRAIERTGMADALNRVRHRMEQHTTWIILSYHMAVYSRMLGPVAAGLFRIPYRRWAPLDYAGGAVWVITFTMIGVVLGWTGVEFDDSKRIAQILEIAILVVLVVAVVTVYVRAGRERPRRPGGPLAVRADDE
jgi:membrane protein DedA with SNARE-associated domain